MTGWLVVNGYLNNKRFDELYGFFESASEKLGVSLRRKTNAELMPQFIIGEGLLPENNVRGRSSRGAAKDPDSLKTVNAVEVMEKDKPDFVLFWDKDVKLARLMEASGHRVFNSADAIENCDDKAVTGIVLAGKGIKMPKTFISPLTYFDEGICGEEFVEQLETQLDYPMVVKECSGSFGEQVALAHCRDELLKLVKSKGRTPFIVQEFIRSSVGRDVRIYVAGGKAKAAIMRYNEKDFRANFVDGAGMKAYTPTDSQIGMAVKAAEILGLSFGGIDILFGENDEPVFCEANSNAHFKKLYTVTGVNMAEEILKCILKEIENS